MNRYLFLQWPAQSP